MGLHSGVFQKIGRVDAMDDCIEMSCKQPNSDVAFMLGSMCYAVHCYSADLCKTVPIFGSSISRLNLNPAISFLKKKSRFGVSSLGKFQRSLPALCNSHFALCTWHSSPYSWMGRQFIDEYNFSWSELSPPRLPTIIRIRVPRNRVSFGQLASRLTFREDLSSQRVEQIFTPTHSYMKVTRHLVLFNSTKKEEENKGIRGHLESNPWSDSGDIHLPLHHWSAGWRNPNFVAILCDCIHSVTQTTRSSPFDYHSSPHSNSQSQKVFFDCKPIRFERKCIMNHKCSNCNWLQSIF